MDGYIIAGVGIVVTLIGALLSLVLKAYLGQIADLKREVGALRGEVDKLRTKHDSTTERIFNSIDDVKGKAYEVEKSCASKIHDLDVTVAGFTGNFVSRSEYQGDRGGKK